MSTFQLFLFILAASVLYMFFKQLFSGSYPKRGVDFEAKTADEQIGGVNRPDKTFSKPTVQPSRMVQLMNMADEAIEREDYDEAKKALGSAEIIDENNVEVIQKMVYVAMQTKDYETAKESCEKLILLND
jgi:tetratricopeptide (TPR) repeat protein